MSIAGEHTHAEGEFDQGCPACVAQAAEDYVRYAHLFGADGGRQR